MPVCLRRMGLFSIWRKLAYHVWPSGDRAASGSGDPLSGCGLSHGPKARVKGGMSRAGFPPVAKAPHTASGTVMDRSLVSLVAEAVSLGIIEYQAAGWYRNARALHIV